MTGTTFDVRIDHVTKRFQDVTAVDDLSLEIESGKFYALLGPSGCGKTTTLRMIGGFEEPSEGTIYLGDRPVTGLPPHKRDVNTVFQSYALFPHLSVFENVAFGLRRRGVNKEQVGREVEEMLRVVGLTGYGGRKPKQLSGGQQQRVALARALINRPRVLLLDEPAELYEHPRTAFVASFLGVSNLLAGTVAGPDSVRLESGEILRVSPSVLDGRTGAVAVGIRPEKLTVDGSRENRIAGEILERAYVGVSTQYVVKTPMGELSVYVQGAGSHAPGEQIELSFAPESTFVVDRIEEVAA